jgi:hypothetical protein
MELAPRKYSVRSPGVVDHLTPGAVSLTTQNIHGFRRTKISHLKGKRRPVRERSPEPSSGRCREIHIADWWEGLLDFVSLQNREDSF